MILKGGKSHELRRLYIGENRVSAKRTAAQKLYLKDELRMSI